MEKNTHRSLEEILDSLKKAEKEFDEKLDKYGLKEVKPKKEEDSANIDDQQNTDSSKESSENNEQQSAT